MAVHDLTKKQLLAELSGLRQRVAELESEVGDHAGVHEELRESDQLLRAIVQASPLPIGVIDRDSKVRIFNPAAERVFGWTQEEALAQTHPIIAGIEQREEALEGRRRLLLGESFNGVEIRRQRKDGSPIDLELWAAPLLDVRGEISGAVLIYADVTERKQAQQALREAEEKYRSIFENAVEGIFQSTPDGLLLSANPALARMYGCETPEKLVEYFTDIDSQLYVEPGRRAEFVRLLEERGTVSGFESETRRKDGSIIWISESARPVRDEDGRPRYYEGTVQDITERKEAEEDLRRIQEAERRLAEETALLSQVGQIVSSTLDIDEVYERLAAEMKKLVDFDRLAINIIDHEAGVFVFRYVSGLVQPGRQVPDVVALQDTQTQHVITTGQPLIRGDLGSDTQYARDGLSVELGFRSTIMVPLFHKGRILGTLSLRSRRVNAYGSREQSILERLSDHIAPAIENAELYSQRTKAEEALRESEERYRSLFEDSRDAIFISSPEGKFIDLNQAALDLFGLTRDEAIGANVAERYANTEDQIRFRRDIFHTGAVREFEEKLLKKDGTEMDCLVTATRRSAAGPDSAGEIQGIIRDITEHKRAEEELRKAEEKYRSIFDESKDPIFITARDGRIIDANQSAVEVFGYEMNDLLGLAVRDMCVVPEDHRSLVLEANEQGSVKDYEIQLLKKDGTELDCLVSLTVHRDLDGEVLAYQGMVRDITDHKRAEETLLQQTRELAVLEERNRMAQEIHDTLAQGFTGIFLQLEAGEQALSESPNEVLGHLSKAKSLARDSLQEARRSVWGLLPHALERLDLVDALQEEVDQFAAAGGEQAALKVVGEIRELMPTVQTAILRICQESLTNVRRHAEANHVDVTLTFQHKAVLLAVQDDGQGFEMGDVEQGSAGGGFGLTGMGQRAKQLDGTLAVKSAKGKGTLVEATIPTL